LPLKIAVVGCGRVAQNIHLPNLRNLPDVTVCAVVDPEPAQRERARGICPQANAFARLSELWDALPVDALLIGAPTDDHAALVTDAISHGVHIYAEKPLAANLAAAAAIVSAWNPALVGMVGFNYRFHPLYSQARRLLAEGAVGRPIMVSSVFTSSASIGNDWRARRANGGGVLLDLASHHVDLLRFLLGQEVTEVHAQTSSMHTEDDSATLQMKLRNDVLASGVFSFGCADQDRIEVFGDRGVLRVDRYLSTACEIIPRHGGQARLLQVSNALSFLWRPGAIFSKLGVPGNDPSYRAALRHFVQSASAGTPSKPDFEDGLRALHVIAAAEKSAREGRWVDAAAVGAVN
jgi:myo-inositol 2-dehydrogenase / D-chiro-inositol 1-dehydrogenase